MNKAILVSIIISIVAISVVVAIISISEPQSTPTNMNEYRPICEELILEGIEAIKIMVAEKGEDVDLDMLLSESTRIAELDEQFRDNGCTVDNLSEETRQEVLRTEDLLESRGTEETN